MQDRVNLPERVLKPYTHGERVLDFAQEKKKIKHVPELETQGKFFLRKGITLADRPVVSFQSQRI